MSMYRLIIIGAAIIGFVVVKATEPNIAQLYPFTHVVVFALGVGAGTAAEAYHNR